MGSEPREIAGGPGRGRARPLPAGPARGEAALTAVIVARNEASNIAACLESLLWADRILLIDDGSTDATAAIAARYTEWIVPHSVPQEVDPVHGNLNFGFSLVPAGWILQVDADERASRLLAREAREIMAGTPFAGFWVPFRFAILGRWVSRGYWGESKQIRLFRAGRAGYALRSLHENVEVSGDVGLLRGPIYHLPYPSVSEFVSKTDRYTSREAALMLRGESPGVSGLGASAAHPTGFRLFWSAARLFAWSYLRLGGWREGRLGVATSGMLAMYGFLEALKVWERAEGLAGVVPAPEENEDV